MEVEVIDQHKSSEAPAQAPRGLGRAAATVPTPNRVVEVAVINQQMWQSVHERKKSGMTVSGIARELDLDRKTVRKCLNQPEWKCARRPNSDHPCRLNLDQGWKPSPRGSACG
jgi:hypothetical protein